MMSIKNGKLRFIGNEPMLKSEMCGLLIGLAKLLNQDVAEMGADLINTIIRNTNGQGTNN